MNNLRTRKTVFRGWIVTALALMLFAFPAALSAQKDKKNNNRSSGQSHSGGSSGGSASHQVQSHQAPSGGGQSQHSQSTPQTTSRPTTTTPQTTSRPTTTQSTPQTTSRPTTTTPQTTSRPTTGQSTPQNTSRPNTGQPGQQYGRPNTGQANPGNAGQPGRQNQVQGGRQFGNGRPQTIRTANGGMVQRDAAGRVNQVHTPGGAVITHRPDGVRRVEVQRPGGRVIVASEHGRGGYIQHPVMYHNQQFVQRTYYVHGVAYARVYRPFMYHGVALNIYTPVRFYRPGFYMYAYSPWSRPVIYNWGWFGTPWFGFYGGFFAPYPQYAGPAFWLTDYLIATSLQEAYQERLDANIQASAYAAGPVGITPDVKQAVADEVHRQLDQERAEAQAGGAPSGGMPIFADNVQHVFVVSSSLMVDARGQSCPVTEGDVLQLVPGQSNGAAADTVVLASKGQDCPKGAVVTVQLQDLQEMQNHMRETIDQGLQTLQTRQGQAGLPPLPASAAGAPVDSPIAADVKPDPNAATDISQAAQEGATAEQAVIDQSGQAAGNPATISLGQSMADVEAVNGKPDKIIDLGPKKMYVYKDLKITFTDGKVSDVQ